MTQSRDLPDPHPCLTFFLASVSHLQQKEIGKREENELGRRRCQAREKEKEKKEMGQLQPAWEKGIKIRCFVLILFVCSKLIWHLLIGGQKIPLICHDQTKVIPKLSSDFT
jgi:hypothetical protein